MGESINNSIPAGDEQELTSDPAEIIELERLPTAASVGLTSQDIQINRGLVMDSLHYSPSSHFYHSSDEDMNPNSEITFNYNNRIPEEVESPRKSHSPEVERPSYVRTTGSLMFQYRFSQISI